MGDSNERKKLVIWSGGMDSTLLLHNLAKESSEENPVKALTFTPHFIDETKLTQEKWVRDNYLQFAKQKGYHINSYTVGIAGNIVPVRVWPQQRCWFFYCLPYIEDNYDVYFGYVQGDCIWLAVSEFYKIFDIHKYLGDCPNSKLHFPMAYKEKWEVLKEIQEEEIPENCYWTCEMPVGSIVHAKNKRIYNNIHPCEKCHPCITLEMAKKELEYRKINKLIK